MKNKFMLILLSAIFLFSPKINFGQQPDLGDASRFAVFTGNGAFTNIGATVITGDVGTHAGAFMGFPPGLVFGRIDTVSSTTTQASIDVAAAYTYLNTLGPDSVLATPALGNGQILTPKVYKVASAATLNGEIILDGQGDPNAMFVFQIGGAFSTGMFTTVTLINSASLCNVYWVVGGAFSLGENSVFKGTVVVTEVASLLSGSSLFGRVLSREGAINLDGNIITTGPPPAASFISASGAVTFCLGNSITLSGNNAGVWTNASTAASITVNTSGDYYVTNTNGCGTATSNHIVVTVNPSAEDYGDLQITTWPVASASVPGCQMTGNAPTTYNAVSNPNVVVWAGAGMSAEPASAGNANADTDNFDDGLGIPLIPLNGGYTYNFTVSLNANLAGTQAYYRLWFDWNNDGDFSNDESIQVGSNSMIAATYAGSAIVTTAGSPVTLVVPVKPPFGASINYKLRLMVSDAAINDVYRNISSTYVVALTGGEVEDYNAPAMILPISFGKVNAEVRNCNVHLSFETLTESNNKQFEIEYSTNGDNWETLAILATKGNSAALQEYNYLHKQPASDYNYYRIRQIDRNGNFAYSTVVSVRKNCDGAGAIVSYPNPMKDNLTVVLPVLFDNATVKLINAIGRQSTATLSVNGGKVTMNTSSLSQGVYLLQVVKDGKTVYNQKLIKE